MLVPLRLSLPTALAMGLVASFGLGYHMDDPHLRTPAQQSQWTIPTEPAAIERAKTILGELLRQADQASATVSKLRNPPFAANCLADGETVWVVKLDAAKLHFAGLGSPHPIERTVIVMMETNGRIARIEINDPTCSRVPTPEPSRTSYQHQLDASSERWLGLASPPSGSNLAEALSTVAREMGNVTAAARIVIQTPWWAFGDEKDPRSTVRHVWSIDLRGIPPQDPPPRSPVPPEAWNHVRHIVDMQTNKWLLSTSVPQPKPADLAPKEGEKAEDKPSAGTPPAKPAKTDPEK